MHIEPIPNHPPSQPPPAMPTSLSLACDCYRPIPEVRAERKGAASTYCARCGRPVPPRIEGAAA